MGPGSTVVWGMVGLDGPWAAADGSSPQGRALLAARIALLAVAWWAAGRGGTRRWLALVGFAFVASLAARVLFVPFALLTAAGAARSARALVVVATVAVAPVAAGVWSAPAPRGDDLTWTDANPALRTAYWAERDNAFRARFWAARWSTREHDLGRAHLVLARIDFRLGHVREAREAMARVADGSEDAAVRAEAAAQIRAWEHADP